MLQKIIIEGLRGFSAAREIDFAQPTGEPGSGLTLLTGPNNSGKSTIIEAIKLRASFGSTPSFNVGMRNARTDAVSIRYTVDGSEDLLISTRPGSSETIGTPTSDLTPYIVPSRRQFAPHFGKSGSTNRSAYASQAASGQAIREQTLTSFEGRLFELERAHDEFDKVMKQVMPDFMAWSIDQNEAYQYYVKLTSEGKTHSLSGSGDGIISIFVIVASLYDSVPGDVIAIDEPELSLHPTIQRRLYGLIEEYAKDRQIVISTHSPYFVGPSAILNGAQIVRTWDRPGGIQVFQISISSCPPLRKLVTPSGNNPHVFGLDAREIFFADDPILVLEGQEDVLFWPAVISSHPELADLPIYGWGAGGAANVANVVAVLEALGYMEVAGVLDNNRPDDLLILREKFPDYHFAELPAADIRTKKVVAERPAVEGLLDEHGEVRDEFKNPLKTILDELRDRLLRKKQASGKEE